MIFVFLWLFFIWNYFVTVSGNFAHTTLSLSLSLPPFPIQGPHMCTKIMCVKITVAFFWEGDLFCLQRWTTLLTRYSWTQNMSSRDFQAPECLSEGRVHINQLQTGAKWPSFGIQFQDAKGRHTANSAVVHRQETNLSKGSDSTPFFWGWGSLRLTMLCK